MSYPVSQSHGMNKQNPILPNWQAPQRRRFSASRGIAMLRALRIRLAEEQRELYVQTQFAFSRARMPR
jgi:hypothetical protein